VVLPAEVPEEPLDEPDVSESPSTEMLLPLSVIGAATDTAAWLPPATESPPAVVWDADAEGAGAFVVEPELEESPASEMALPPTVTGAATWIAAWLPPRRLSAPEVLSSAEACPAKNRIPPPTSRAVCSPRRTYVCMIDSFPG
jgi:hypothetical protein